MPILTAEPVDQLSYRTIAPETAHRRLALLIARVLAVGCLVYTISPLLQVGGLLVGSRGYFFGLTFLFGNTGSRSDQVLANLAMSILPWMIGAAAVLVIITASGVAVAKRGFRRLLVFGILFLALTSTALRLLQLWPI